MKTANAIRGMEEAGRPSESNPAQDCKNAAQRTGASSLRILHRRAGNVQQVFPMRVETRRSGGTRLSNRLYCAARDLV